jgi:Cysteine-rich secretory protein family
MMKFSVRAALLVVVLVGGGVLPTTPLSAAPLSASPVTQSATDPEWLTVTNLYRASAGVDSITENLEASAGAVAHSKYLVLNRAVGHDEYPDKKGFSRAGLRAGKTGDVYIAYGLLQTQRQLIEGWMTAPFHGLAILSNGVTSFGFGAAGDKRYSAATLPIRWDTYTEPTDEELAALVEPDFDKAFALLNKKFPGVTNVGCDGSSNSDGSKIVITCGKRRFLYENETIRELRPDEVAPPAGKYQTDPPTPKPTTVWPGPDTSVPLVAYSGNESPDPLAGCPGFGKTAGLPILIERDKATEISVASLVEVGGGPLELCTLTEKLFTSNDSSQTEFVSSLLYRKAILIPRKNLRPGASYDVSVTFTDGETKAWRFSSSLDGQVHVPASNSYANIQTPGVPLQPIKTAKVTKTAKAAKSTKKPTPKPKTKANK